LRVEGLKGDRIVYLGKGNLFDRMHGMERIWEEKTGRGEGLG